MVQKSEVISSQFFCSEMYCWLLVEDGVIWARLAMRLSGVDGGVVGVTWSVQSVQKCGIW